MAVANRRRGHQGLGVGRGVAAQPSSPLAGRRVARPDIRRPGAPGRAPAILDPGQSKQSSTSRATVMDGCSLCSRRHADLASTEEISLTTTKQWTISPDVAYVDGGERVVVVDLAHLSADGPRILLGPAAEIWRAVVDTADEAEMSKE